MKSKWRSRKFWAAAAGVAVGAAVVLGMDADVITTVSGALVACASVVTYIITGGKLDAAAVEQALKALDQMQDMMDGVVDDDD